MRYSSLLSSKTVQNTKKREYLLRVKASAFEGYHLAHKSLLIFIVCNPSATCNFTLHYSHWIRPGGSWHPEYLSVMHLPRILEKKAQVCE